MKKYLLFIIGLLFATAVFAQTQKGYVKTKGRLDNEGNLIPGTPLSEVIVKVKDRNEVMSDKRGDFSFPMPDQTYYLESVAKNGYVLIDQDILSKQYSYSKDKLVIALETKDQQIEERMDNFRKINEAQNAMITKLRAEVKQLKEENKITEEEYYKRLQEIVDMQNESQKLVEEMVERYSKMDFDQLSEFELQVKSYILSGDLLKAKNMIMSKGDLTERAADLRRHQEANAKERVEIEKRSKKLEKSEVLAQKKLEELAKDYYDLFEIYKLEHKNDSAAYYIELRAALDTTNVEWLDEAGLFVEDYIADYTKAKSIYELMLRQSQKLYGEKSNKTAYAYNNMGSIYSKLSDLDQALKYSNKALCILEELYGDESIDVSTTYNNIGVIYYKQGDYENALKYYFNSLKIREQVYGHEHQMVATSYCNIATLYISKSNYENALEYNNKALEILLKLYGQEHPDVASAYSILGGIYFELGNFDKSLEFFSKSMSIREMIYGGEHPETALSYNQMGGVYQKKGDNEKALEYYYKSLNIREKIYGREHPDVATIYNNLGVVYCELNDYEKALECYNTALNIRKKYYGNEHPYVAISYNNLGSYYSSIDNYEKALEYYRKSLRIREKIFGTEHINVAASLNNIGHIYMKQEDYVKANEYLHKALKIFERVLGEKHPTLAILYNNMGTLYSCQEQYNEALEYYVKASEIFENVYGPEYDRTQDVKNKISEVQAKLKESKKK